jgi:predicted cupin superfamily sugar epimerase
LIPASLTAAEIVRLLGLVPHPEGGHFRETFRDARCVDGTRAASTAIHFLLARGERSHWHRIDAVEVWHFYAGAPLLLETAAGAWRAAESCGAWTLVGCTVAPGFTFERLELAPKGWRPDQIC